MPCGVGKTAPYVRTDDLVKAYPPLLTKEGIDVDNVDVPDLATLQATKNHSMERQNMAQFTPVGQARDLAVGTLRLVIQCRDRR